MKRIFVFLLTILFITFMANGIYRAMEPAAAISDVLTTYVLLDTLSELRVSKYLPSKQKTTYIFMRKMLEKHSSSFRKEIELIYKTSKKGREQAALFHANKCSNNILTPIEINIIPPKI